MSSELLHVHYVLNKIFVRAFIEYNPLHTKNIPSSSTSVIKSDLLEKNTHTKTLRSEILSSVLSVI